MELLFKYTQRGYGFSNEKRYYVCDDEQEYNELVVKYKQRKPNPSIRLCWIDDEIFCEPQVVVSDGYATFGGKHLKCIGITDKWICGGLYNDYSSYDYYINPSTIEIDEDITPINYWV